MYHYDFPACCGININTGIAGTPETLDKELKNYKGSRSRNYVGMNLIACNDGQKVRYHETLEANGWRLVVNGAHNQNHDSRIYLYACVFRPEKSEANLFPAAEADY